MLSTVDLLTRIEVDRQVFRQVFADDDLGEHPSESTFSIYSIMHRYSWLAFLVAKASTFPKLSCTEIFASYKLLLCSVYFVVTHTEDKFLLLPFSVVATVCIFFLHR